VAEIFRVIGVLKEVLARNGSTGWLIGDKCTYADLSFVTWAGVGEGLLVELGRADNAKLESDYLLYSAWMGAMREREKVAEGRAAHGLK
jgi:glutathione S-transferase